MTIMLGEYIYMMMEIKLDKSLDYQSKPLTQLYSKFRIKFMHKNTWIKTKGYLEWAWCLTKSKGIWCNWSTGLPIDSRIVAKIPHN